MKLPEWNCGDNVRKQKILKEWTLEQLDDLDKQLDELDKLAQERELRDADPYFEMTISDAIGEDGALFFDELRQRSRLVRAVKARDADAIIRLMANNPELQKLAIRLLIREPGRMPGEARPTDRNPQTLDMLQMAARDVTRIYDIWQSELGKKNRSHRNPPTAVQIAAGRWGLDVDELQRYRKTFAA